MMLPASGYSKTLMYSAINPMTGFQEFFDQNPFGEDWLNEQAKRLGYDPSSGQKRGEYFKDQGLTDVWQQVKFNESGGAIGQQKKGVGYAVDDTTGDILSYQTIGANKPGMTGPNDNTQNYYAIGDNTNTLGYGSIQIGGDDGVSAVNISSPIDPATSNMPTTAQPWNNSVNAFIQNGDLFTRAGSDFTGGLEQNLPDFQAAKTPGQQDIDIQALIDSITDSITGALNQNNQQNQPVIPGADGTQTFDMQSFFQQFMQMQMLMQMLGMNGGTLPMALAGMLGQGGAPSGTRYIPSGAASFSGGEGGNGLGGAGYGGYGSRIDPFTGAIIANPANDQWRYSRRLEAMA